MFFAKNKMPKFAKKDIMFSGWKREIPIIVSAQS